MESYQNKKGFSLIEILVVLGIILILFTSFFLIWNNLDIFRRARDAKRINDLSLIESTLKTLILTNTNVNLGNEDIIYTSLADSSSTCGSYSLIKVSSPYSYHCVSSSTLTNTDGLGWIPIDFTQSKIVILSSLPVDPLNNQDYFYAYQVKNGRYKLTAKLESPANIYKMLNDGGFESTLYEIGSDVNFPSPQSGLVSYWSFDEGSGNIAQDYSGYGNNGTIYSSTTPSATWVDGKVGKALSFDGVDDYISIGAPASLSITGPITIEAWIYPKVSAVNQGFVHASAQYIFFVQSNNEVRLADTYGHYLDTDPNVLTLNTWNHIVGVFYGSKGDAITLNNAKIFVNGVSKGKQVSGSWSPTNLSNVVIASRTNGTYYFNGLIDEVRIYNRALSDEEIKAIYEANK